MRDDERLSCCVLISSFDGYSDAWDPFIKLFNKYWKDCPFKVFFISNEKSVSGDQIVNIRTGKDLGWASNLKAVLKKMVLYDFLWVK